MSIEADAQKDLALSEKDAEGIVGGKKTKKAAAKHTAARSVPFIQVPGFTGTPDSTLPESDCDPDESAAS